MNSRKTEVLLEFLPIIGAIVGLLALVLLFVEGRVTLPILGLYLAYAAINLVYIYFRSKLL